MAAADAAEPEPLADMDYAALLSQAADLWTRALNELGEVRKVQHALAAKAVLAFDTMPEPRVAVVDSNAELIESREIATAAKSCAPRVSQEDDIDAFGEDSKAVASQAKTRAEKEEESEWRIQSQQAWQLNGESVILTKHFKKDEKLWRFEVLRLASGEKLTALGSQEEFDALCSAQKGTDTEKIDAAIRQLFGELAKSQASSEPSRTPGAAAEIGAAGNPSAEHKLPEVEVAQQQLAEARAQHDKERQQWQHDRGVLEKRLLELEDRISRPKSAGRHLTVATVGSEDMRAPVTPAPRAFSAASSNSAASYAASSHVDTQVSLETEIAGEAVRVWCGSLRRDLLARPAEQRKEKAPDDVGVMLDNVMQCAVKQRQDDADSGCAVSDCP